MGLKTVMRANRPEAGNCLEIRLDLVKQNPLKTFFKRMMDGEYRRGYEKTPVLIRITKGGETSQKIVAHANEGTLKRILEYGNNIAIKDGKNRLNLGVERDLHHIVIWTRDRALIGQGEWFTGNVLDSTGKPPHKKTSAYHYRLLLEQ